MKLEANKPDESFLTGIDYEVKLPNGDFDLVTVYDLPKRLADKWIEARYPNCEIEFLSSIEKV